LLTPGEGPIDCSKCLAKMVIFAAEIARQDFPDRVRGYIGLAENLVPPQSLTWTYHDLEREVRWYIKRVGAEGSRFA